MTFLLVSLTVVIIIAFELLRNSRRKMAHTAREVVTEHPTPVEVVDRYFHPAHSWALVSGGIANVTVGVDDFSERFIGTLSDLELPEIGQTLLQGDQLAMLHHGNRHLAQAAPVSGTVVEVNEGLKRNPSLLNHSPYERGWIARIAPSRLQSDLRNLLSGSSAEAWRLAVRTQFMQLVSPRIGTVLQDGGELINNIGDQFNDDEWKTIVREFFPGSESHQPQNNPTN